MPREVVGPFSEAKVFAHMDRLRSLLNGNLPPPVTVEIDLADGFCNQACPHCFFSTPAKSDPVFFPLARASTLATELRDIGVRAIEFPGGGEPTTHPHFEKMIEAFGGVDLPMGLVTNGLLFRKILPVINLFQWVRISLDAGVGDHYRRSHGSGAFDAVVGGIRKLVIARRKTKVGIGFLVTPENWSSISSAVDIARFTGVDYIQFRPASKVAWPTTEERDAVERTIESVKESNTDVVVYTSQHKWSRIRSGRSFPACQTSALVGIIKADGTVPFCCLKRDEAAFRFRQYSSAKFSRGVVWNQASRNVSRCMS